MNVADRAGRQPPTQEDESRSSEQKSPDHNIYRDDTIQFLDTTGSRSGVTLGWRQGVSRLEA